MDVAKHVDELKAHFTQHLDKWGAELLSRAQIPQTGHSYGISFEPAVKLDRLPGEVGVDPGFYMLRGLSTLNPLTMVEVKEPSAGGLVEIWFINDDELDSRREQLSEGLFNLLHPHE